MKENYPHMNWDSPDVNRYEETISLKIPGYVLLYEMMDRLLTAQLRNGDGSAELLIVGAGGGQEIVTLGSKHEKWIFTGIDPSERMLEIAKARVKHAALENRVSLIKGTIDQLPQDNRYDGAACMLVLHFVKGLPQKLELLRRIAERLKPGSPFFLASINGEPQTTEFSLQMQAWRSHMLDNGITQEEWERFAASIGRESDPIPAEAVKGLLEEAGFACVTRYFGSYLIEGYFAIRS